MDALLYFIVDVALFFGLLLGLFLFCYFLDLIEKIKKYFQCDANVSQPNCSQKESVSLQTSSNLPNIQITPIAQEIPSNYKIDYQSVKRILQTNNIRYFYHFTDIRNLDSIRQCGGLMSWKECENNNIKIPNAGGDGFSRQLDEKYNLQDYVRLSFCEDHPMSYKHQRAGCQMVLLRIKTDVAYWKDTLFSDMNATDKNHSHGGGVDDLKKIKFQAVKKTYVRKDDDEFKYHQAEVLVKTYIPLDFIVNIDDPIYLKVENEIKPIYTSKSIYQTKIRINEGIEQNTKEFKANVAVSVISCPKEIKGRENTEMINFLQAYNADDNTRYDIIVNPQEADAQVLKLLTVKDETGELCYGNIALNTIEKSPILISALIQHATMYIDKYGNVCHYENTKTIIKRIETILDYQKYMRTVIGHRVARDNAMKLCKEMYGGDWSLETAAEEEKERYAQIYDTFSRMEGIV